MRKSMTPPPGKKWIFRPWITKNGKRIYASRYGKKVFRLLVDE